MLCITKYNAVTSRLTKQRRSKLSIGDSRRRSQSASAETFCRQSARSTLRIPPGTRGNSHGVVHCHDDHVTSTPWHRPPTAYHADIAEPETSDFDPDAVSAYE